MEALASDKRLVFATKRTPCLERPYDSRMPKRKAREPLEWARSPAGLQRVLSQLHDRRRQEVRAWRNERGRRSSPTSEARKSILVITANRCHICGGKIHGDDWVADHVASFATGGGSKRSNYLPAHRECNGYKWYYSSRELRWILRMGIWARNRMEMESLSGAQLRDDFWNWEKSRRH